MTKTILITGSTDGIGLLTAQTLAAEGHTVLLHGRNAAKLEAAAHTIKGSPEQYMADLSHMADVHGLVDAIRAKHSQIDVVINNAGILKAPNTVTKGGYDLRFMVNTIAPYVLTRDLLPIIAKDGRVVNLSSAAQAPVDLNAFHGGKALDDMDAYAQSKLALTIWSREMAKTLPEGPVIIAVNPGSLLASKMVKEGFGIAGNDLSIGASILCEAALGASFSKASGKYFDNDSQQFAQPHVAALDATHSAEVMRGLDEAAAMLG
ncbi:MULTISPECIES: SDR family NAD(P)-dependent oxidoreductase [Pacificibacter]|uniref:SDR family NAD(P)-dependent oxidoreductase n=1 Tax=Pacificibacter TaxID=1042323 RepID=UPI001C08256B|nr:MULTISPECIES: SDR family NAD(P)-dependent oxidoreductase [Pacificibacter]MBU2936567.1 SDR family NAD(P)-dependent oxidoreductase [Pacificibacter marinus]MDO6614631.1 SDR family NAD(P)-dependent oxidoreductase [Pacificibacter sp. 1_MG-2023]